MRVSRRELAGLLGAAALTSRVGAAPPAAAGQVGIAALAGGRIEAAAARAALAAALAAAAGMDAAATVRRLFRPADVVGVKLNCIGGRPMSPRPVLVEALVSLLVEAGVAPERIILFERSSRELSRAGHTLRREGDGHRCYGIDNDFDRAPSASGSIGSCYARLVSTTCTALVSFGVVKDHGVAGVAAGMKNWYGVIHNPNKYHDNGCDPYVADVMRHPFIKDKLRLTLLDGGDAQCHGGPSYRPDAVWPLGLVAASLDPVAADAWAWRVIDAERRRRGMPELEAAGRAPRFIATGARAGLGAGDRDTVREVRA